MENFFGIVRQSCGSNDHPTPSQFLIVVNCLSFYNLAKAMQTGNTDNSEDLVSLLQSPDTTDMKGNVASLDELVEAGNLTLVEQRLNSTPAEHRAYVEEKSDDRLIHYMAGYVARKFFTRNKCEDCRSLLLQDVRVSSGVSKFTEICDRGGLLYPSKLLFEAVKKLEGIFTTYFSREELCSDSIVEM